jgi:hypothetical protein
MAADNLQITDGDAEAPVTREWVKLIMVSFRNEMRLLVFVAVVGSQFLNHVSLPPLVGFIGGGVAVAAGIVKLVLPVLFR